MTPEFLKKLDEALKTPVVGTNFLTDADAQRMNDIYQAARILHAIAPSINRMVEAAESYTESDMEWQRANIDAPFSRVWSEAEIALLVRKDELVGVAVDTTEAIKEALDETV